jgi:hypothetical protein
MRYPREIVPEVIATLATRDPWKIYARLLAFSSIREAQVSHVPDEALLTHLVDAVFFASLLDEEGSAEPLAVVLVGEGGPEMLRQIRMPWRVSTWRPSPLDATTLRKLGAVSAPGGPYLVASPLEGKLHVCGIGSPQTDSLWSGDFFVRVNAVGPGALSLQRGGLEIARYSGGGVHTARVEPSGTFSRAESLVDVDGFGSNPAAQLIRRLSAALSHTRCGGMIVIGADDADTASSLNADAYRLEPPIRVGKAALVHSGLSAGEGALQRAVPNGIAPLEVVAELQEASRNVAEAARELDALVEQATRLSRVDGALLFTPSLDLVAFACKLRVAAEISNVSRFTGQPGLVPYDLSQRGTRHRAAATFATEKDGRVAICASQDGPVTVFERLRGKAVAWTMNVASPWATDLLRRP